jgi:hypothetical protein
LIFSTSGAREYEEITVRGSDRLPRGLREPGFVVERFDFSSTMPVYEIGGIKPTEQRFNETSEVQP